MSKWISNGVEFNVGDTVKVVRSVRSESENGMGCGIRWDNTWANGAMDEAIGNSYSVTDISEQGVGLDGNDYNYPLAALEKVFYDVLPAGDFHLIDVHGVTYEATYDGAQGDARYNLDWTMPTTGIYSTAYVYADKIESGIAGGFWKVCKSPERELKEATIQAMIAECQILINEIKELEKELAE